MCVKNEAKGLEKAILSCRDFVSEIIISVDNKSSDATADIAKKYADVLMFHDFDDDFAKMRNKAHACATGDWILFLDGHEYVTSSPDLDKMLELPVEGLLVSVRMENGAIFRNPRLYKNGVQFAGAVHEKSLCKNVALYPAFVVQHDRVNFQEPDAAKERSIQRDEQTPRIMAEEIKKDPNNIRAIFHMALFYTGTGEYSKAIKFFKKYLSISKLEGERWFVCFQIALCYLLQKKHFLAYWWAEMANKETANRWEIRKMKGMIFFSAGKWSKALDWLLTSFEKNECDCPYIPWPRDISGTWNLAGECFLKLKNYEKARLCFDHAFEICEYETQKKILKMRVDSLNFLTKNKVGDKI